MLSVVSPIKLTYTFLPKEVSKYNFVLNKCFMGHKLYIPNKFSLIKLNKAYRCYAFAIYNMFITYPCLCSCFHQTCILICYASRF